MDIEHDWTLLPAVVVRSAGFPWELVLSLAYLRAAEAAAVVVHLERKALDLLADAPAADPRPAGTANGRAGTGPSTDTGTGRPSRGLRGRLRDLRPLPSGAVVSGAGDAGNWVLAWNEVTGLLERARLTLTALVGGDAALTRGAVAELTADERFLDALVCSAPGLYRDLRHGAKGGRTRRELAAHLQRLTTSCETDGCYGPLNYGTVRPGPSGHTWQGHRVYAERLAYPAGRVNEALQQRILADPTLVAGLVPRRRTLVGEVRDGAAFTGHCDGRRTLAEIAAETGIGMERAAAALTVAVRRGLLTHDLCPPAGACDPLAWLRDRLTARGVPIHEGDDPTPGLPGPGGPAPHRGSVQPIAPCECRLPPHPAHAGFPPPGGTGLRPAAERDDLTGHGGSGAAGGALNGGPGSGRSGSGSDGKPGNGSVGKPGNGSVGKPGNGSVGAPGSGSGSANGLAGEPGSGLGSGSGRRSGAGAGEKGVPGERPVGQSTGAPGRGQVGASGTSGRGFVAPAGVPVQRGLSGAGQASGSELPVGRRVGEISELLARYPAASPDVKLAVQRRIEALAGLGGHRDDQAVVHEAAAGTLRVGIGDALAADLRERVPRVLDLLAEEAELTRLRTNRLLAGRLGPGTYALADALRMTGDLEIDHGDRLSARIAELVRAAPPGATVLNLAGLLDEPAPPAAPVLCSADVMVAAPELEAYEPGVTPLVLTGLHDGVLLTPWALQFHDESDACLAERDEQVRRALAGFTVLNVVSRPEHGVPRPDLPGPVLELNGGTADPGRRRIGLDELYVHSDGRRAVLHAKGFEEPLLFNDGEHDTALHTALALPRLRLPRFHDLPRMPRLTWDNVVLAGRRRHLEADAFEALGQAGGDGDLLVSMARLRETYELPVVFYAATARERIYVDTRSPALLEGLARLAAGGEGITVSEVLPGPEGCWLRDGEHRFAAELRCVYLRPAGPSRREETGPAVRAPVSKPAARLFGRSAVHPYPWPGETTRYSR
ncbi:hypothetical protein ACFMQL_41275 [Nonomuraea fastidiosa]|uniref:hypothetical protein n=1 Tax=Nonomuraea TaxID=83681 RepID=UPI0034389483